MIDRGEKKKSNPGRDLLPAFLILLALALYLPGITWGLPDFASSNRCHAWGNDDLVPLAPLAEMHNTFIVAKPDRNVAYPLFHYFLLSCAYGPYLLYLYWTGGLKNPGPDYPFGLSDPPAVFRGLTWIGRSVSVLLALAVVLGAYYTAKHLWGRKAGFFAAVFTMLMYPMAYYARVGNLDVAVLGWASLGLAMFALSLRHGLTVKRGAWLGAFVALAAATKEPAIGSFFLLPFVLLWLQLRSGKEDHFRHGTTFWRALGAAGLSFLVVYIVASGIPIDPARYVQHVQKLSVATSKALYLRYPATLGGYLAQLRDIFGYLVDVMSWPVLIAAGLGVAWALRNDRRSLALLLSSLGFVLILVPVRFSRIHYLLPVALPLTTFAGCAFSRALDYGGRIGILALIAAVGTSGCLLLQTVDLTHDMVWDSHYAASAWFDHHARSGDVVLYFTNRHFKPPLRPDIETVEVLQRELALSAITGRKPEFILIMPDDVNQERWRVEWRIGPHSIHSDRISAEDYERLVNGTLAYRLVARFQTPRLFPWLDRPFLSFPTVNPPIHIFAREDRAQGFPRLEPWNSAPYYPKFVRVHELTVDSLRESRR